MTQEAARPFHRRKLLGHFASMERPGRIDGVVLMDGHGRHIIGVDRTIETG